MPFTPVENSLVNLLRQCYLRPQCQTSSRQLTTRARHYTRALRTSAVGRAQPSGGDDGVTSKRVNAIGTQDNTNGLLHARSISSSAGRPDPDARPQNVAILGGGITGLSAAYYLAKEIPTARITLYEGSDRLGGWLHTKVVDVGNGTVALEQGPRTLRPSPPVGSITLSLVKQLGLEDEMILTSKRSVAAQNRFIYYPDHLVQMPARGQGFFEMVWSIFSEDVFKGIGPALLFEFSRARRPSDLEDESIGSFLERRMGTRAIADNLVSAVLHGIYAGDIYQLSIQSLFRNAWHSEGEYGSLTATAWNNITTRSFLVQQRDLKLMADLVGSKRPIPRAEEMRDTSVYSFRKGIAQLSDTLAERLKTNPNITIKTDHRLKRLSFNSKTNGVEVSTARNQPPKTYDHVISTVSARTLSNLTGSPSKSILPSLGSIHSVTVMVVNLYFTNPDVLPAHGFGYLIPRSIPWEENPERALGVVFDSDATTGQDTAPGTKVTVMLGGHWWDDFSSYPDEEEGAAMAKAILKRHLGIEEEPALVHVSLQRECIPQYTVGHDQRLRGAHDELLSGFQGKLAVAGNSYTGVGLNDCVRAGRDVAHDVARYQGPRGISGLEQFKEERKWIRPGVLVAAGNRAMRRGQ